MLTAQYPAKTYFFQLGKLLVKEKPDIAKQLIEEYLPQKTPIESDLTKIPSFFLSFCQLQEIEPEDYIGPLYKSFKIDKRRLFVAVIIAMYHPRTWKLAKYLSETIGVDKRNIGRLIQEVEFSYNKIQDFKAEVDDVVQKLKAN